MPDAFNEFFVRCPDAIFIMDGNSLVDFNPPGLAMLGLPDRESVFAHYGDGTGNSGLHPALISPPVQSDGTGSLEKAEQMLAIARDEGSHRFAWDHVNADGNVFPSEVLLTWIGDPENERFHVIVRDTTEQVALDARLRRAERLRMLGTLAGGVAHDFNNLLSVVRWHAESLETAALGDVVSEHAAAISESVDHGAALTRQLLSFSRGEMVLPRATDIADAVARIEDLMSVLTGEHIAINVRSRGTGHVAIIDPSQVEQTLINLVVNARDAMPRGGRIDIEIGGAEYPAPRADADETVDMVVLSVSDTGSGMDPEQAAEAFEPFVTSKQDTTGSGLGLAIVQAIAEQNGGWAELTSAPGVGTTVRVLVPRTTQEPESRPGGLSGERKTGTASSRVLLVEDNEPLRQIIRRTLGTRGHDVVAVATAAEAARLARDMSHFDVVVTDVVMPGMGGPELIEMIAATGEGPVRAVLMSGYAPNLNFVPPEGVYCRTLAKPFSASELDATIRSLLDEPSSR